jgi:acetolactate synthase-1/2/3 large subunit
MANAFRVAVSGRPGPVVIDVPKDIQVQEVELTDAAITGCTKKTDPDIRSIVEAAKMINRARKPVIYAGGGIIASGAFSELEELAQLGNIPVAVSLMGLSSFRHDSELYLGLMGMHGNLSTNLL